jgi:glycosyltransferase involved in cell wall biosynthesis
LLEANNTFFGVEESNDMLKTKVTYIISDIDKALAFEWIADHLNKEKFDLNFILLNNGNSKLEDFLNEHKISVERINIHSKKDWPSVWLRLFFYFKRQKPDIIHCHLFTANILGLSAAKMARVKHRIYTRHHSDYHFRYFSKGVKWDKLCNYLATAIIAPSGAVKKVLTEMESVPEAKIQLIHHGFDLAYFSNVSDGLHQKLRDQYNLSNKSPVIGVISRFTELKGIQYIIPAFQKLLIGYPNALLLLFNARGDYEKQINSLLETLPKGSFYSVPFEQELAAIYSLFDIFVQVSVDTNIEAFGQTYVEALAAGVPSIFTLAGIAPDFIINGENAVVVPFKDAHAIYNGMIHILQDRTFSDQMIQKGKKDVYAQFAISKMISALENLYMKIYVVK